MPETVVHGETGLLFAAGDVDGYVGAILQLLKDPSLREQLGRRGRERVVDERSLTAMVGSYESLFERLHEAKSHSRHPEIRRGVWPDSSADLGMT